MQSGISRSAVLGLCTVFLLLTSVGITSFSLFLHPIEVEFGWSRVLATLPYTAAMAAWGLSSPLFGKLADDFGVRPVILWGIVVMAAGFAGMSMARSLWQLSLSFGLLIGTAMGACGLNSVTLLISKHFDRRTRARAVSLVQIAPPLTPLIFAPILFALIVNFSWRVAAQLTAGLLLGVALPLAWIGAHDPNITPSIRPRRLSWRVCFSCLRDRQVLCLFVARFSCGVAFFQLAHLVALAFSKGFQPATAAFAVSVFGGSSVFLSLLAGWLSDRYGRGRILALTYFVRGLGTLAFLLPIPNTFIFYLLVIIAIGPTFGTVALNNVMFFEAVGPRLAGRILGLSFFIHQIGAAGGPILGSIVFDSTGSYDWFLLGLGAILLVSGAMTYGIDGTGFPVTNRAAAIGSAAV